MNSKYDLISIGDPTIDHFIIFHDATVTCKLDKTMCQLSLNYADKLPVDKYVTLVAGNAANNAVGSARLGLKTAYYAEVGSDEAGIRIKKQLEAEGIDTEHVYLQAGQQTNSSFVLSFQGERTILVYHAERQYALPELPPSQWVYLTSTGHGYEKLYPQVLAYIKKHRAKLAYNPGTFQLRGDRKLMAETLKQTEIVFINVEEAQQILATTEKNVKTLLAAMRDCGPAAVVITDGQNGAYAYDGRDYFYLPEYDTVRVETTGAGDSFATGVVAALHDGQSVGDALRWGSFNATSVVKQVGPQAGLLTKSQMEQRLRAQTGYHVINFTDQAEAPALPAFIAPDEIAQQPSDSVSSDIVDNSPANSSV